MMPQLPVDLIEDIIDIVAECYPQSLPDCAQVSSEWNPRSTYHLYRTYRTPTVTTFSALHAFRDVVKKYPRLAALATSLKVAPDLQHNSPYASYVPFHHLSSSVLSNIRCLVLGDTLRWNVYPPLYRHGTFALLFYSVTTLDISCHFGSISDLFRVVRSFRKVEKVRMVYPHHDPPQWMFSDQVDTPVKCSPILRQTFKLSSLEISVGIIHERCGIPY